MSTMAILSTATIAKWFMMPKRLFFNLLYLSFISYFLYFMIYGSSGFLNLLNLTKELYSLRDEYNNLEDDKKFLLVKNKGLTLEGLNLDILEEESKKIGYANNDEIIILNVNE